MKTQSTFAFEYQPLPTRAFTVRVWRDEESLGDPDAGRDIEIQLRPMFQTILDLAKAVMALPRIAAVEVTDQHSGRGVRLER